VGINTESFPSLDIRRGRKREEVDFILLVNDICPDDEFSRRESDSKRDTGKGTGHAGH
jgi:hypothetical protein